MGADKTPGARMPFDRSFYEDSSKSRLTDDLYGLRTYIERAVSDVILVNVLKPTSGSPLACRREAVLPGLRHLIHAAEMHYIHM